jgi:cobalt-zinc-cadmium efflux system protein
VAIALSYFTNRIGQRPKDNRRTFGYKRAEIISAFINSTVLLAISALLIYEAIKRISAPEKINGSLMIIVASIGLVANLLSVFLLKRDSQHNLNIKSSYLHLLSDTLSSVGVLVGGVAISLWNVVWIDPVITILISLFIFRETWHVVKMTIDILMQSSAVLDYEEIKKDIERIDKVKNIHHVHSWMINEKTIYFEAHIDMEDILLSEVEKVYDEIEHVLKENYGISHVTIQAECDKCDDKNIF